MSCRGRDRGIEKPHFGRRDRAAVRCLGGHFRAYARGTGWRSGVVEMRPNAPASDSRTCSELGPKRSPIEGVLRPVGWLGLVLPPGALTGVNGHGLVRFRASDFGRATSPAASPVGGEVTRKRRTAAAWENVPETSPPLPPSNGPTYVQAFCSRAGRGVVVRSRTYAMALPTSAYSQWCVEARPWRPLEALLPQWLQPLFGSAPRTVSGGASLPRRPAVFGRCLVGLLRPAVVAVVAAFGALLSTASSASR